MKRKRRIAQAGKVLLPNWDLTNRNLQVTIKSVIEVRKTYVFSKWLAELRDAGTRWRIQARIDRAELGNTGDVKAVGGGVLEMRIRYGPGYRVYFVQRGTELIILLAGGDKSSQEKDIKKAQQMARDL